MSGTNGLSAQDNRLMPRSVLARSLYEGILGVFAYLAVSLCRLFAPNEIRRIQKYIDKIYGIPRHARFSQKFVHQCYRHQVAMVVEVVARVVGWPFYRWEGVECLHETIHAVRQHHRGYIIITGHYGSWEFVGHHAATHGQGAFYALAKPSPVFWVTKLMGFVRGRLGISVLWTDRPRLLRDMLKVVAVNDGLGFVMDQKPPSREGPKVSFFGIPTLFVSGPAKVALKAHTPVIAVFCERMGPFHYKISHKIVYDGKDQVSLEGLAQLMASEIEQAIRRHPDQWLWNYRRWSDAELGAG